MYKTKIAWTIASFIIMQRLWYLLIFQNSLNKIVMLPIAENKVHTASTPEHVRKCKHSIYVYGQDFYFPAMFVFENYPGDMINTEYST